MSKLLISLPPSDPAVTSAKIVGWKEPLDYKPVVECLAFIKYGAFDDYVQQSAPAIIEEKTVSAVPPPESGQAKARVPASKGRAVP